MLNNEYLRRTANAVDGGDTPEGARILNNEYLRRIAEGIDDLVDAAGQATDPVDVTRLSGVISAANLPSYVDDVVESYVVGTAFTSSWLSETQGGQALVPEGGKIYVVMAGEYADTTWRWGGSAYVPLGSRIEVATTAEAVAGTNDSKMMTPAKTKAAIDAISDGLEDYVSDWLDAHPEATTRIEDGSITAQKLNVTVTYTVDSNGNLTITLE